MQNQILFSRKSESLIWLSNARKADLKNAAGVDTSKVDVKFAKTVDLVSLKSAVNK